MRDPNRIKPYCDTIASIWGMVPDWRLSQLMMNCLIAYHNEHGHDAFYTEDEEFLNFMYKFIGEATNENN